jgi:tripartite-type tricarboxylate transporter receptor subunit TctC
MKKILAILLLVPILAFAWEPTKPVEGLIAWGPGSVNDLTFRVLAAEVEKNTGAKFVVTNRGGAGGVIGTEELSKRAPDGYSVTVVSVPGIAAMDKIQVPEFGKGRSYTTDSFIYPLHVASSPFVIVAHPKDPVNNPAKFIQILKTEKVSIAATGGARIVYEAISARVKFTEGKDGVVRVDHKGPVDALMDVAGGNVRFAIVPSVVANPLYKDGKVNIIALSGPPPMRQLPGVGLISDALPDFGISGMWGLMIPANTPKDIVDWYVKEFSKALNASVVKSMFYENLLLERPDLRNPEAFKRYIKGREKEWQPLVDTVLAKMNK